MSDLENQMPEADTALIEMTAEVVAAYVARNHVRAAELPDLIATVHASLAGMGRAPEAEPIAAKLVPPVSIKKSVTDEYIISLEDGKQYQALKRHLSKLGMTPEEYRAKWGLPKDYPMVAPAYSAKRSALAKSLGLGNIRRKR
jgi:predicted transcriptional regulator